MSQSSEHEEESNKILYFHLNLKSQKLKGIQNLGKPNLRNINKNR